jgi:negative regulator of sigma E activity
MTEAPYIIEMNIARYRALLKLEPHPERHSLIERLLDEAEENFRLAINLKKQEWRKARDEDGTATVSTTRENSQTATPACANSN